MPFFRNVPVGNAVFNACNREKISLIILLIRDSKGEEKYEAKNYLNGR